MPLTGNYYSLKGHHEKAVKYFRRALKLNPKFLSAWTLMGHEYVELRNAPAAIEAYRRAVGMCEAQPEVLVMLAELTVFLLCARYQPA